MPKSIETTKLRNHLASAIKGINKNKDFMVVTRKGEPVAGIVDLEILEDIESSKSKKFIKSIKEARDQIQRGEFYTHKEAFGDI